MAILQSMVQRSKSVSPARRALLLASGAVAAAPAARLARAGAFPDRPVTLIVPFPPGGATDRQFRILARHAARRLGQPVVVVNRAGAAGTLAPAAMARAAAADGHTLSVMPASVFRPADPSRAGWDPERDFSYVIALTRYSHGIGVRTDGGWQDLDALLAAARGRPNTLSYGATGAGSSGHLVMEQLSTAAGARLVFVPFKGAAEWQTAVLGGHIDAVSDAGWGMLARAGRLRMLATATAQRVAPAIPTLRELGHDLTTDSVLGIAGPMGLPADRIRRLHDAFLDASRQPAFRRALADEYQPYVHLDSVAYARYAAAHTGQARRTARAPTLRTWNQRTT